MNTAPRFTTARRALGALLVITALVAAGCGSEDDVVEPESPPATSVSSPPTTAPPDDTTTPPPTTADSPETTGGDVTTDGGVTTADDDAIAYDPSPETVLLRVSSGGGFVPMEYAFTEIPQLVVYGDGRVLRAKTAVNGMGAVIGVDELQLDEEGVQALLAAAEQAGLLDAGSIDYGTPNVTDLPGTTLTLSTANGDVSHSAYALGFDPPTVEGEEPVQDGLTDTQREARKVLSQFIDAATDIETLADGHVGAAEDYVPEQLAIQAFAPFEEMTEGQMKPWPVDEVDPPKLDTCTVLSGPDAAAAAKALATAGIDTTWTLSGRAFRAAGRPILPGEDGCPA